MTFFSKINFSTTLIWAEKFLWKYAAVSRYSSYTMIVRAPGVKSVKNDVIILIIMMGEGKEEGNKIAAEFHIINFVTLLWESTVLLLPECWKVRTFSPCLVMMGITLLNQYSLKTDRVWTRLEEVKSHVSAQSRLFACMMAAPERIFFDRASDEMVSFKLRPAE